MNNSGESHFKLLEKIEDIVEKMLGDGTTDSGEILKTVKLVAPITPGGENMSDDDFLLVTKRLEERFDIKMEVGNFLSADGYMPWVDEKRSSIDWYYWNRYKRFLPEKKFTNKVINVVDLDTNKILDHLEDPGKEGCWKRKGLVVGHVQSGKTANYIGLICKAADAGYKIIIVLAGLLNPLRNQTQERIDEGFVGLNSAKQLMATSLKEKLIGVGKYYDRESWRTPVPLTTNEQDFDKHIATQLRTQISHFNEPIVFVLKKHVSILKNLIDWFKTNNSDLNNLPMLLIDDEADHASVNTRGEDDDPTTTNRRIRQLLNLFEQSSYLGYTATPFANIFIDPEHEDEMLKDDLFPSDFIISLDTPTNYIGAKRIFEEGGDLNIVRNIYDYEEILPLNHTKIDFPENLPPSLCDAICVFILVKAARNLRGQKNKHNSMLINVSRFTDIQTSLRLLVHDFLTELRDAIKNHYALPEAEALNNSVMKKFSELWAKEFSVTEFSWVQIQRELNDAVSPVSVIEVNSSRTAEPLCYEEHLYPNGRNLIAIGGLSLSRGLTLEGLTVSYFLRASIMYDTLMQMGRWFGYRPNFEDLCRIYMTEEAESWYQHISGVTEELRDEFRRMEKARMTPQDFGLCVRSHPETLIVTARNKMRTGQAVTRQISLKGRLVETSTLLNSRQVISGNHENFRQLLKNVLVEPVKDDNVPGYLFKDVSADPVKMFINSFINHPASHLTDSRPVVDYIERLESRGVNKWDVIVIGLSRGTDNIEDEFEGLHIVAEKRKVQDCHGNGIVLNKHRVASRGHEKAGLTKDAIEQAELAYLEDKTGKKNFPDSIYRGIRKKPLLMVHILDCRKKESEEEKLFDRGIIAYGISFPGATTTGRDEDKVEYVVNTVWWKKHYAYLFDEE